MKRKLIIRPIAKIEYAEASLWYYKQTKSKAVSRRFFSAVETIIDRIPKYPERYAVEFDDIRIAPVPKYPYCIYFFATSTHVVITAVYHHSRDPDLPRVRH